jgi:multicomponent K+:H+ antiporter subunit F
MGEAPNARSEQERIRRVVLIALVSAVTLLFLWMIREFLLVLLLAALGAGMLYPIYQWISRKFGGRKNLAAGTVVGLLIVLVLGIRNSSTMYFEAALLMALFGFVSSTALAKFLFRGEVIE